MEGTIVEKKYYRGYNIFIYSTGQIFISKDENTSHSINIEVVNYSDAIEYIDEMIDEDSGYEEYPEE